MFIYIYNIYIYREREDNQEKNVLKSFRFLSLSIYLHKTATISKYLQFLIYKLKESVVETR